MRGGNWKYIREEFSNGTLRDRAQGGIGDSTTMKKWLKEVQTWSKTDFSEKKNINMYLYDMCKKQHVDKSIVILIQDESVTCRNRKIAKVCQ